jgi:ribosomal protein S18 acetylase RimI-like enzyme
MRVTKFRIRLYQPRDLEALYEICLKTGDSGKDATGLYKDPSLLGKLYAAPYAVLERELCFVLEDDIGVCGYILGALDSDFFYRRFVNEWLPTVLPDYEEPQAKWDELSPDEKLIKQLYEFDAEADEALKDYPSHLHIDLLPRAQQQGQGKKLMQTFLGCLKSKGSSGVHLGLGINNDNAYAFYKRMGFIELERDEGAIFMAMKL